MDRRPPYPLNVPVDRGEGPSQGVTYQQPHVLDPGHGPQTVHRSDLLFMNSNPHMNYTRRPDPRQNPAPSPISTQLYPYHQQAFYQNVSPPPPPPSSTRPIPYPAYSYPQNPPYYDHRQRATSVPARPPPPVIPPPLPPKPIVYPALGPARDEPAPYTAPLRPPPPLPLEKPIQGLPPLPSPEDDSNELAMALALSQSESVQREMLEEQLRRKEEEDLAKALAESVLSSRGDLQSSSASHLAGTNDEALSTEGRLNSSTSRGRAQSAPEHSFSIASSSTEFSHVTDSGYAESVDHDRPNASGASQVSREANSLYSQRIQEEVEPVARSSLDTEPPDKASEHISSRPLSISSASSLPYTRPSPQSNAFNSEEIGNKARAEDNEEYTFQATSPAVAAADLESDDPEITEETILAFDDEAYARQLAAEEEELARQEQEQYRSEEKRKLAESYDKYDKEPSLPAYSSVGASSQSPEKITSDLSAFQTFSTAPLSSRPIQYPTAGRDRYSDNQTSTSTSPIIPPSLSVMPVVYPSLGQHTESDARSEASHHSSIQSSSSPANNHADSPHTGGQTLNRLSNSSPPIGSSSPVSSGRRISGQGAQSPSQGMLNANHFIDRELLMGVSIGFTPPPISTRLVPMQGPMPNIISLPYARCPPLHLQAPDWRHLLRLMARLSGTRIEPTVEAMAISKSDLRLRTVVQFLKPHPASNEWRTIVWFSIDHPVPPNTPGASRYLTGNPNLLPWSYTLSPVPMLLRDAHDTHLSKTYTIPTSEAVPLPTLPITFPNLALYLQAALDYSRHHSGDQASGVGKLGKMVQMCYPNLQQGRSEFDVPERSTMGHLFKRVMGRGNKDKRKGKGTNNEETYQLVTPFVPDEWG